MDAEPFLGLDFIERTTTYMGSSTYRWIDVKRFSLALSVTDVEALDALMRHERFRDHYTTNETNWVPTDGLHGPFRIDQLNRESYTEVRPATARELLREWAEQWDAASAEGFTDVLMAASDAIPDGTTVFCLVADREKASHDWGWVLGDFHEFVVINRVARLVVLLVASDD